MSIMIFLECALNLQYGFFSLPESFTQHVKLLERGGIFFPGRIVVDRKQARVVPRIEN